MKKQLIALFFTGMCFSLVAQNDLKMTRIAPRPYAELKAGNVYEIACSVMAETDIVPSERITIAYIVNDGPETIGVPKTTIHWLRKGEVESFKFKVPAPDLDGDTIELKVYFKMASDTNAANDTATVEYLVNKRVENDLKIDQVSTLAKDSIKTGTPLEFSAVVHNVGSNTLKSGTYLLTGVIVNNWYREQPVSVLYEEKDLEPGDSAIIGFEYIIRQQFDNSEITLCYEAFWAKSASLFGAIESNTDDNRACAQLKVGKPSSVDGISESGIKQIRMTDGQLLVSMTENLRIEQLEMVDVSGKRVFGSNHHLERYVVGSLPEGIYLVRVRDGMGRVYAQKMAK